MLDGNKLNLVYQGLSAVPEPTSHLALIALGSACPANPPPQRAGEVTLWLWQLLAAREEGSTQVTPVARGATQMKSRSQLPWEREPSLVCASAERLKERLREGGLSRVGG